MSLSSHHPSNTLKPGRYRHYKGSEYQVFKVARHSETEESLVVYRCLYGDFSWWVRPLDMFTESVEVDGETLPRFEYIGDMPYTEGDNIGEGSTGASKA